ncbi:FMN-binding protein [Treponema sp. OttesenSCG-928-L16]|nr:FMN-binding protein [Treponema sp. OttesenSCG-928-L16]
MARLMSSAAGILLISVFFSCLNGGSFGEDRYKPGVYEGRGEGWGGPIIVELTVSASAILYIEIIEHRESPLIGGPAMEELLGIVTESGTIYADALSGATVSSCAFLNALEEALSKAEYP